MRSSDLSGTTALVTGASRGFGRRAQRRRCAAHAPDPRAYAERAGLGVDVFVKQMGAVLTPESVGDQIVQLASSTEQAPGAYLLTPDGQKEISS